MKNIYVDIFVFLLLHLSPPVWKMCPCTSLWFLRRNQCTFFYFLSPLKKEQTSSWSKQSAKFGCNWPSDSGQWFLSGQYIFHHRYFAINSAWRLAWLIIWKTRGPQALTVTSVPETGQISCPKKGPILFLIIKFEDHSFLCSSYPS